MGMDRSTSGGETTLDGKSDGRCGYITDDKGNIILSFEKIISGVCTEDDIVNATKTAHKISQKDFMRALTQLLGFFEASGSNGLLIYMSSEKHLSFMPIKTESTPAIQ